MDYQFLHIFTIGHRPEWSAETAESLRERMKTPAYSQSNQDMVEDFIQHAVPGDHTVLTDHLKDGSMHQVIIVRGRDD